MSQSRTIGWSVTRDGEDIDLSVDYTVAAYDPGNTYGLPEDCEPASGGEIEEANAFDQAGKPFELTNEERSTLEAYIYANHDYTEEIDYGF